jgi:hypothetical protein
LAAPSEPTPEFKTATSEAPSASGEFNWLDDDSIVLRDQRATAIYRNHWGGLVIRQECAWNEEDDPFVVINPENIEAFLDRLTEVCGIPSVP